MVAWLDAGNERLDGRPKIIIYAPASIEEWGPESPVTTGIGASESQIVELARWMSKASLNVTVYGSTPALEVESCVTWRHANEFRHEEECDLLIAHRAPWIAHRTSLGAKKLYVWLHDQPQSFAHAAFLPHLHSRVARYVALTKTMALGYQAVHGVKVSNPLIPYFLPGCDLEPLRDPLEDGPICCYLSAPYRGLRELLRAWRYIVEEVPEAKLRCAYGWQVFNSIMSVEGQELKAQRVEIEELLNLPGVAWLDRIPQQNVKALLDDSHLWLYPCTYPEQLCHVAMRAQARGVWPVVHPYAALAETVADGRMVDEDPTTAEGIRAFANATIKEMVRDPAEMRPRRIANRDVALRWHDAAIGGWTQALTEDGIL